MDAAQATLQTIPKAAEHADLAQRMANDLIYDRPHPDEWLAHPEKDMETLRHPAVGGAEQGPARRRAAGRG